MLDKIIFINLEHRKDRLGHIIKETDKIKKISKFGVERIPGVIENPGIIGCAKGHLAATKLAIEHGWKKYMVLEDDFLLRESSGNELCKVVEMFFSEGYSEKYDILVLGHNHLSIGEREKDCGFVEANYTQTMSGYIVTERVCEELANNIEEGIIGLTEQYKNTGNRFGQYCCDIYWNTLRDKNFKFLATEQSLGTQLPSFSDIEGRNVNYGC